MICEQLAVLATVTVSLQYHVICHQIRFLRQVQDETIRLSTLASYSARYCDEDITICSYKIPARTPMIQALGVGLKNKTVWEDVDRYVDHVLLSSNFA